MGRHRYSSLAAFFLGFFFCDDVDMLGRETMHRGPMSSTDVLISLFCPPSLALISPLLSLRRPPVFPTRLFFGRAFRGAILSSLRSGDEMCRYRLQPAELLMDRERIRQTPACWLMVAMGTASAAPQKERREGGRGETEKRWNVR